MALPFSMISSLMRLTMTDGIEKPTPIEPAGLDELDPPVEAIAVSYTHLTLPTSDLV